MRLMTKLPPLNALRAFEAAARHGGYIDAAEELHVTRGAISRHVKLLEDHLGVPLFRRHTRGVTLTEAGQRFLPVLTECFARIETEARRISRDAAELRILCPPATSIRWLIPRLDRFRARHPDIRLSLTTDFHDSAGFVGAGYDLAFSIEHWPNRASDVEVLPLFQTRLAPACAPSYLQRLGLKAPADLARATLLHETPRRTDWRDWLDSFDVAGVDRSSGSDFPNLDIATRAAVMGEGVVMADMFLCRDELASGLLVMPFPEMICESHLGRVCVLGARERWDSPQVRAFRAWLEAEAAG